MGTGLDTGPSRHPSSSLSVTAAALGAARSFQLEAGLHHPGSPRFCQGRFPTRGSGGGRAGVCTLPLTPMSSWGRALRRPPGKAARHPTVSHGRLQTNKTCGAENAVGTGWAPRAPGQAPADAAGRGGAGRGQGTRSPRAARPVRLPLAGRRGALDLRQPRSRTPLPDPTPGPPGAPGQREGPACSWKPSKSPRSR